MTAAQFEILHAGQHLTDATDMTAALYACEAATRLGYVNLTIRKKVNGKLWNWNSETSMVAEIISE